MLSTGVATLKYEILVVDRCFTRDLSTLRESFLVKSSRSPVTTSHSHASSYFIFFPRSFFFQSLYTPAKERCSAPPVNLEEAMCSLKDHWNRLVTTSFDMLLHFPSYCTALMDKIANVKNKEPPAAKASQSTKEAPKDDGAKKCAR